MYTWSVKRKQGDMFLSRVLEVVYFLIDGQLQITDINILPCKSLPVEQKSVSGYAPGLINRWIYCEYESTCQENIVCFDLDDIATNYLKYVLSFLKTNRLDRVISWTCFGQSFHGTWRGLCYKRATNGINCLMNILHIEDNTYAGNIMAGKLCTNQVISRKGVLQNILITRQAVYWIKNEFNQLPPQKLSRQILYAADICCA